MRAFAKIFISILSALVLALPAPVLAQGGSLTIVSGQSTVTVGEHFNVEIRAGSGEHAINAAEVEMSFPPDALQVTGISKRGSIFEVWIEDPTYDNVRGRIRLSGGIPSPGFLGTEGSLITMSFKSLTVGVASLRIVSGALLANDGKGTNVLASLRGANVTIRQEEQAPEEAPREETPSSTEVPPISVSETPTAPATETGVPAGAETGAIGTAAGAPAASSAMPASGTAAVHVCADGVDNDEDGLIDYPEDTACDDRSDNSEVELLVRVLAPVVSRASEERVRALSIAVQRTKTYNVLDKKILSNPIVEKVNVTVAEPIVVTTAIINAGTAVQVASFGTYLRFLLTEPLLFFARRRKRRGWGTVYSSLTKLPIDLAIVRLFDPTTGRLLRTRVTDERGRYLLMADPGTYQMGVVKAGFTFPSTLLRDQTSDLEYADLYLGGAVPVVEKGASLIRSIPLDPVEWTATPKQVARRRRRRAIQRVVAWGGPMMTIVSAIISPSRAALGLVVFQFFLLFMFKRLAEGKRPRASGSIRDEQTGVPLPSAVVRLFDVPFNKLLEMQVTDRAGRFAFLAGRGGYYMTVEKRGYEPHRSATIDVSPNTRGEFITPNIRLKPVPPNARVVDTPVA